MQVQQKQIGKQFTQQSGGWVLFWFIVTLCRMDMTRLYMKFIIYIFLVNEVGKILHLTWNSCVCVYSGGVVTCLPHQFQCGSQECLDPALMCNGITNCADGSDEGGSCQIKCAGPENTRCSQSCYSTPQGTVRTLHLHNTPVWLDVDLKWCWPRGRDGKLLEELRKCGQAKWINNPSP